MERERQNGTREICWIKRIMKKCRMFEEEANQDIGQRKICCSCCKGLHELLPVIYQMAGHYHNSIIALSMARKEHNKANYHLLLPMRRLSPILGGWKLGEKCQCSTLPSSVANTRIVLLDGERIEAFVVFCDQAEYSLARTNGAILLKRHGLVCT